MQIVIDIPQDTYEQIIEAGDMDYLEVITAIENGTPLPKGHGRLIDADELREHMYTCETNGRLLYVMDLYERLAIIDEATVIIEAAEEADNADR